MPNNTENYLEGAVDLRIKKRSPKPTADTNSTGSSSLDISSVSKLNRDRRPLNIFQKHKLKYRYLQQWRDRKWERKTQSHDSGQYGSSSLKTSSSNASGGKTGSSMSNISLDSSSPSSGASSSPVNAEDQPQQGQGTGQDKDQIMSMVMGNSVPLVVMMQGQIGRSSRDDVRYSNTVLFKCNMCDMFSNVLEDVLNHVRAHHQSINYCFVCNKFHSSKTELDRHKAVCETAQQAFQQIVDGHYQNTTDGTQETALNLTVAGNVAMRAAQMLHNRKGRHSKIKKLLKCTYCKKAFFGRFYLQRHLRSHTGEKICFCSICGKGFVEWRNLRNHLSRFHNNSENTTESSQKSVSPNLTSSDSDSRKGIKDPGLLTRATSSSDQLQEQVSFDGQSSAVTTLDQSANQVDQYARSDNTCQSQSESAVTSISPNVIASSSQHNPVKNEDLVAPAATFQLGSTSSRLTITQDSLEKSLHPVSNSNGERIYQCQSCSKTFRTKFAMQRHLDFHADKRPFQCDQCSYKAKTKPQLKVHLMRHTGEKSFHCNMCNYSCVTHSDLNRHCKSQSHIFRAALLEKRQGEPLTGASSTSSSSSSHSQQQ